MRGKRSKTWRMGSIRTSMTVSWSCAETPATCWTASMSPWATERSSSESLSCLPAWESFVRWMISSPTRFRRWSSWAKSTRTVLERGATYCALVRRPSGPRGLACAAGATVAGSPMIATSGVGATRGARTRSVSRTAFSGARSRTSAFSRQACSTASLRAVAPAKSRSNTPPSKAMPPSTRWEKTSSRRWT